MTKSAMIRARVDPMLKEEVEAILQELGLSTTQAITLFYQQVRLTKGLPFEVRLLDKVTLRTFVSPVDGDEFQAAVQQYPLARLVPAEYLDMLTDLITVGGDALADSERLYDTDWD
jgi:DNA-damage-inducible protein J